MKKTISFLYCFSLLFFAACQHETRREDMRKADGLVNLIKNADDIMVIDENVIRFRIDSMGEKLSVVTTDSAYKTNDELSTAVVVYKGILSNYKKFLEVYPSLDFDTRKYADSVATFRENVLDGKLFGEELDKKYASLKKILSQHLDIVKRTAKIIYETENTYNRKNEIINVAAEKRRLLKPEKQQY